MTKALAERLGIGPEQQSALQKVGARLKSVGTFLADAINPIATLGKSDLLKGLKPGEWGSTIAKHLEAAAPWAEVVGAVAPPLKLLSLVIEKVTKPSPDPKVLAYLAWSNAYQWSVMQAVEALAGRDDFLGEVDEDTFRDNISWAVKTLSEPEEPTIEAPTLTHLLDQKFVCQADALLDAYGKAAGYSKVGLRELQRRVHERFGHNLRLTLSHGDYREKFAPLTQLLELGGGEELLAFETLNRHAEYQRYQFEEARVLRQEPFSLAQVHIPTDCGFLTWAQCRDGMPGPNDERESKPDPFKEKFGGRQPLLETILTYLGDKALEDVIIVQGIAGSGKSTFTLRLCVHLIEHGLRPIRVRLRDVDLHLPAKEAIPAQVLWRDDKGEERRPADPDGLFRDLSIFDEDVEYGGTRICPYVLILDGWDELDTTGDQALRERIPKFIDEVRRTFMSERRANVRVILTGRPWSEVTKSDAGFLEKTTPVLTIRPWSPEQLGRFFTKIRHMVELAPLGWPANLAPWPAPESVALADAKKQYERSWEQQSDPQRPAFGDTLEILGSPLLAHLTVRLLGSSQDDVDALLSNTTHLYRRLTDTTCVDGGRDPNAGGKVKRRAAFTGERLRRLLQVTATAMTIEDQERLPHDTLEGWIRELHDLDPLGDDELVALVEGAIGTFPVAELMVAFFFKGGRRDLGCEFAHKSFREYLFAEAIVEVLKRAAPEFPAKSRKRAVWWEEFSENDPRHALIRALGPMLAAQWLTTEVVRHLASLLRWEIGRTRDEESQEDSEVATVIIGLEQWKAVRDALADLWEWWTEGVHLRTQVKHGKRGRLDEPQPYAVDLAQLLYSQVRPSGHTRAAAAPVRTTTIDAHLGDALSDLCTMVHAFVAEVEGYPGRDEWQRVEGESEYQSWFASGSARWVRFRPGGSLSKYMHNYIARINAAGWRPRDVYPARTDLSGVDLSGADLRGAHLYCTNLRSAHLHRTNLNCAILGGADLSDACLGSAHLTLANLNGADLSGADLRGAGLSGADLRWARLRRALLQRADLEGADLEGADLEGAHLAGADLSAADLSRADLKGADLEGADLEGADLEGADLRGARVTREQLAGCACLDDAQLDRHLTEGLAAASQQGAPLEEG